MNGTPRRRPGRDRFLAIVAMVPLVLCTGDDAAGQSVSAAAGPASGRGGSEAIDVSADQSLELHQAQKAYVARGRAVARRGDASVAADILVAYWRDLPSGGTEVYRLLAEGNVTVAGTGQSVTGERGIYDLDRRVAVMSGGQPRFMAGADVVAARDTLEYWERERLAVARGDAVAVRGANRVSADRLVALVSETRSGERAIERMEADGNVVIITQSEVVRGREAVYDAARDIATMIGDVRVTRGQNQLNGDAAEIDFATGISRMVRVPSATTANEGRSQPSGRVRGLFIPGQQPGQGLGLPQPRN